MLRSTILRREPPHPHIHHILNIHTYKFFAPLKMVVAPKMSCYICPYMGFFLPKVASPVLSPGSYSTVKTQCVPSSRKPSQGDDRMV